MSVILEVLLVTNIIAIDSSTTSYLTSTFGTQPILHIVPELENQKALDFTITDDDSVYIIVRDSATVLKYDLEGNPLGRLPSADAGVEQPMTIASFDATVILADVAAKKIHFFVRDAYQKSVSFPGSFAPRNVAVVGDRIFCSGFGYAHYSGGMFILDRAGAILKNFVPDIEPSPYDNEKNALWTRVALSPFNDRLVVGLLFQSRGYVLDQSGELAAGAELSHHYAAYERESQGLIMPDGYAAVDFCGVSKDRIIIAVCDNKKRECGQLMLFDGTLKRKLDEYNLNQHVWKLKYFPEKRWIGFIDGESSVVFMAEHG